MKHLNPRQGITTVVQHPVQERLGPDSECETPKSPPGDYNLLLELRFALRNVCVKHLNPRQGITTKKTEASSLTSARQTRVKHLNPRQGITTPKTDARLSVSRPAGVKHLNPRQGITTCPPALRRGGHSKNDSYACETPKSPPGDYNSAV